MLIPNCTVLSGLRVPPYFSALCRPLGRVNPPAEKQKGKNIQQLGFAAGHPRNY
ncbi:hypothetical protein EJ06DRAFT_182125 [Trichodelitschia bisporula]|uniref:Uncharacterized protein n=1 Tax=Trichodelitschia bisporula TaxID=703511 RepID=A0A6G1HLW8_9PEZI|nr:hypothetical protein EJ06DRAFT_182125 [Trichodelitschia bisporula]